MESVSARYRDVLGTRSFSFLWAGQVISNFGDRFNYMAVMGLILFNWGGSALDAGFMFIFMTLPALLFGPIAGVYVDRYEKKRVMILCDIVRAGLVALLPFATSLFQVYALIFLVSSVSRFFYPARSAIIPLIVSKDSLLAANSLSQSTYQVSAIAGYAVGGALVGLLGPLAVFYLDAVSYLVSAVFIWSIRYAECLAPADGTSATGIAASLQKAKEEMADGLQYVVSEKRILYIFSTFSLSVLFFGGINILWVILVRDVLGLGIGGMGILESSMGGGMLVGTVAVGYLGYRVHNRALVLWGLLVSALSFLFIGVWAVLANVLFWVFVAGAALSFVNVPAITIVQRITPQHLMGRVFGLLGTLLDTASLISMGVVGLLADLYSVQSLIIASAVCILVITGAAALVHVSLEVEECPAGGPVIPVPGEDLAVPSGE